MDKSPHCPRCPGFFLVQSYEGIWVCPQCKERFEEDDVRRAERVKRWSRVALGLVLASAAILALSLLGR